MKKAFRTGMTQARQRAGNERIPGTVPSHPLTAYVGEYEHPAYGRTVIRHDPEGLRFAFRAADLALGHVHYDRFDTPDDELRGKWSLNFTTDPQGDIGALHMVLDQAEATFTRVAPHPTVDVLLDLCGTFETASGVKWQVGVKNGARLYLCFPGTPDAELVPYKASRFRIPQFPDRVYAFETDEAGRCHLRITGPEGVYLLTRIEL